MKELLTIRCKNNSQKRDIPVGSSLEECYEAFGVDMERPPLIAQINNKVEGMHTRLYQNADIEYFAITHPSGRRTYMRTLFFVLAKAVHDEYQGRASVVIDIPVSNGYYCDLKLGHQVTADDVSRLRRRMQQIVDAALPIRRHEAPTEEVKKMFRDLGTRSKVQLLETVGKLYTTYYEIDGYVDYFYGAMLTNTSQLTLFDLVPYYDGALLQLPAADDPDHLGELIRQDKMFEIFREHHQWQNILGIGTIGAFNEAVKNGHANTIINVAEALQERKIAHIGDLIAQRKDVRMVLIAGPSSSGKTTTCKRISVQLLTHGIRPVQISLDDYFVDREHTPRDAAGDFDYEHLHALNIPLLNKHLAALFRGEEVQMPHYNFQTGQSEDGPRLQLQANDILVVEGIHALNPELTAQIPDNMKFRVYASALTTILLDTHNYIPTTDNRLLRRIIRDYKYRGCSATDTIRRWPSVRRGENRWIFPFQEQADVMFNTAMIYELAVIKSQAEPILEEVREDCPEYAEAYRLRKFLSYLPKLSYDSLPPTSLLREFLGGSIFEY